MNAYKYAPHRGSKIAKESIQNLRPDPIYNPDHLTNEVNGPIAKRIQNITLEMSDNRDNDEKKKNVNNNNDNAKSENKCADHDARESHDQGDGLSESESSNTINDSDNKSNIESDDETDDQTVDDNTHEMHGNNNEYKQDPKVHKLPFDIRKFTTDEMCNGFGIFPDENGIYNRDIITEYYDEDECFEEWDEDDKKMVHVRISIKQNQDMNTREKRKRLFQLFLACSTRIHGIIMNEQDIPAACRGVNDPGYIEMPANYGEPNSIACFIKTLQHSKVNDGLWKRNENGIKQDTVACDICFGERSNNWFEIMLIAK